MPGVDLPSPPEKSGYLKKLNGIALMLSEAYKPGKIHFKKVNK